MIDKKEKLISLANQVLNDPDHKKELEHLLLALKLRGEDVVQAYVAWDFDSNSYGNEIYDSLPLRLAMYLHYLLKGSWHEVRQNEIIDILNKHPVTSIVDVGFGAPQRYIKDVVLKGRIKATLLDIYDSALIFSKALLDYWDPQWQDTIELRRYNMDIEGYIGDYDLYLFQDSIEHTKNPTQYLKDLVFKSPVASKFVFSL